MNVELFVFSKFSVDYEGVPLRVMTRIAIVGSYYSSKTMRFNQPSYPCPASRLWDTIHPRACI